jgi:prepilin-type N-terminal cleavage/methylation domain-containing protein
MRTVIDADEQGFTLVEVLVSLTILAGAIVMTFQVFGDGLRGLQKGQNRTADVRRAQHQIDAHAASSSLAEGVRIVKEEGVDLRIAVDAVPGFTSVVQRPFKLKVFSVTHEGASNPILETIVMAKPTAQ